MLSPMGVSAPHWHTICPVRSSHKLRRGGLCGGGGKGIGNMSERLATTLIHASFSDPNADATCFTHDHSSQYLYAPPEDFTRWVWAAVTVGVTLNVIRKSVMCSNAPMQK
mmetsp:Transcript_18629/g.31156  ORF Transcript_18629/g.31156 Transcript_18629/m.31156 type:complete len:110 (-) Transcript_18629:2255-2584(-)